jgi:hypothetical protein
MTTAQFASEKSMMAQSLTDIFYFPWRHRQRGVLTTTTSAIWSVFTVPFQPRLQQRSGRGSWCSAAGQPSRYHPADMCMTTIRGKPPETTQALWNINTQMTTFKTHL